MSRLRLAVLDLYNGIPNQGMRCIRQIAENFADQMDFDVFDVRAESKVPDMSYDIFISSGGPGDPLDGEGEGGWEEAWHGWLDEVYQHNLTSERKKFVFFICHSFQMATQHFSLAEVGPRKSISFGTFPVHPTEFGEKDIIFEDLDDPFYAADFRRFQATQPNEEKLQEIGAKVLCLEKIRPHIDLERAIMAIRWSPEIVGVQFHPEADPEGMLAHFSRPEIKIEVIADHGRDKWLQMMEDLTHPERITRTHDEILPGFLRRAAEALMHSEAVV
jgi:GMP synthase-like glutamine amidotransferase